MALIGTTRPPAETIDELAFRLLRAEGASRAGTIAAVIVVEISPTPAPQTPHLDTRLLILGERTIVADRGLVQAPAGMPARFFVFHPAADPRGAALTAVGSELRLAPKVALQRCTTFEDALE